MGRMNGKVALVTGAARGIGRAIAVRLAEEGADILALDCPSGADFPYAPASTEDLQITVKEVESLGRKIIAHEGDVRNQSSLDQLVDEGVAALGGLDVAVANAALMTMREFSELTEKEFADTLDINIIGVWRTLKSAAPAMKKRGGGSMIVTSSGNGVEASPHYVHYVTSKHGVLGLAKSAALVFARDGIRVNSILPGPTDTPGLNRQEGYDLIAGKGRGQGVREDMENVKYWTALRDVGLLPPRAMGEAALWLASDESRWTTGLELIVDAGHVLMPALNMEKIAADQSPG